MQVYQSLGAGCGQLRSIDLGGCSKVTDAGISALGAGCGQLQSINLNGCVQVRHISIGSRMWSAAEHQSCRL